MTRRSLVFTALAVATLSLSSTARAGTITVTSDSGSLGGFTLTNIGVSGNVSTLSLAFIPPPPCPSQVLNQVTDTGGTTYPGLNIPALFDPTITLVFTRWVETAIP